MLQIHNAGTNWTEVGVLLTAAFTGGIMLLGLVDAMLGWRRAGSTVAHSFALQSVQGAWTRTRPSRLRLSAGLADLSELAR